MGMANSFKRKLKTREISGKTFQSGDVKDITMKLFLGLTERHSIVASGIIHGHNKISL